MSSQIQGVVKNINETKVISEKFKVQIVVIETEDQYPQTLAIQFVNDKIKIVDKLNIGDKADFNININGREYTNKSTGEVGHFISLNCWSFTPIVKKMGNIESRFQEEAINNMTEDSDMPF